MHKFKYIQLFYKVKKHVSIIKKKHKKKKIEYVIIVILTKEYDINIQT